MAADIQKIADVVSISKTVMVVALCVGAAVVLLAEPLIFALLALSEERIQLSIAMIKEEANQQMLLIQQADIELVQADVEVGTQVAVVVSSQAEVAFQHRNSIHNVVAEKLVGQD